MLRISCLVPFLTEHNLVGLAIHLIANQQLHYGCIQVALDLILASDPLQKPACKEVLGEFGQDDDGKVEKRAFFEESEGERVVNALKLEADIHQHVLRIASNG